MADFQKTINILFTLTDEVSKNITGVGSGIDKFGKDLGNVAAPIANVTKKLLLLEAAIVAIGVAFAVKAFNESVKFEGALLDLQKVLSDSEGSATQYTGEIDALALKYGESATDILQGAADIKQAGFDVSDAFLIQDAALKGAVISELEVNEATTLLIRGLKGFKAPAEDVNRILDLFNEVSNKNATNVRELAGGFAQLSPLAKKLGLSYEETIALMTPIIEVFGSGAEAGNALKIALTSLIVPTGPAADELERLGVAVKDSSGELRNGRDIIFDTIKAMDGLSETQKVATLAILAGERQAARLSESLGNLSGVTKVLEDQMGATGSATKEFNVRIQASEKQIDRAGVAFDLLSRTIGDQFRVELTGLVTGFTDVSIAISKVASGGGLDPLFDAMRPHFAEWKALLTGIAKALPEAFESVDLGPILRSLGAFSDEFGGMFDGLDLTKPEDLAKVLNGLIENIASFIDINTGMFSVLLKVGSVIGDLVGWFLSLDSETQKVIGQFGATSIAITAIVPIVSAVGVAISSLTAIVSGVVALLAGPLGLAVAAAAAGVALGTLANLGVNKLTSTISDGEFDSLGAAFHEWVTGSKESAAAMDEQILAIRKVNEKLKEQKIAQEAVLEPTEKMVDAMKGQELTSNLVTDAIKKYGNAFEVVEGKIIPLTTNIAANTGEIIKNKRVLNQMEKDLLALGVPYEELIKNTKEDTKSKKDANKELEKQVLTMVKYKIELEAIQSKERVSIFELKTKVDLSKIEAATDKIRIVFDSITEGITSTGDVTLGLFDALSNIDYEDKPQLKAAIEAEQKRRDEQFELQQKLIEQEIELNDKRLEIISDEIKINFALETVEPELETIMWNVIDKVKATANARGADFLLGLT